MTTSYTEAKQWFSRRLDEIFEHYDDDPPAEAITQAFREFDAMIGRKPGVTIELTDEERREWHREEREFFDRVGDIPAEEALAALAEEDDSIVVESDAEVMVRYRRHYGIEEPSSQASSSAPTRIAS